MSASPSRSVLGIMCQESLCDTYVVGLVPGQPQYKADLGNVVSRVTFDPLPFLSLISLTGLLLKTKHVGKGKAMYAAMS